MLQTANPIRSALIFAALTLCAVGCKQQEGEVCQDTLECGEGLTCCPPNLSGDQRGICQTACTGVSPTDAGPGTDAALDDAGPSDAGPEEDGGPDEDAGPTDSGVDAGPTDAGPADAGPIDAGPDDAGPVESGA